MDDDDELVESMVEETVVTVAVRTTPQLPPSKTCLSRIHSELRKLEVDPIEGICVVQDDEKADRCHAIIIGPQDTPYEGGFFYFVLDFPPQFPFSPPKVTLQTTGGGTVRFNPNLYANGEICLSILGTWSGPCWSPVQTIGSVLLSIQSLMGSEPCRNEPGYEDASFEMNKNYNHCVRHETLRVAVLEMLQSTSSKSTSALPEVLSNLIRSEFLSRNDYYIYICEEYSFLNGRDFQDPFGNLAGKFVFDSIKQRITQQYQLHTPS